MSKCFTFEKNLKKRDKNWLCLQMSSEFIWNIFFLPWIFPINEVGSSFIMVKFLGWAKNIIIYNYKLQVLINLIGMNINIRQILMKNMDIPWPDPSHISNMWLLKDYHSVLRLLRD